MVKFVDSVASKKSDYEVLCPQVFNNLGTMPGEYTIRLHPDAVPFAVSAPRRIPIPLQEPVNRELDKMEQMGVIRRVQESTEWCAGIVPVQKPSGDVRICVDLPQLNKFVLRERYTLPTVDKALGSLAGAEWFSKLDANSGFYQVRLSKASELLTTFITPFGRYCFTRLPFGITSAPEYFRRRMSEILAGLPGVVNLMDDILIFGNSKEQHDARLSKVLARLVQSNVTLNKAK